MADRRGGECGRNWEAGEMEQGRPTSEGGMATRRGDWRWSAAVEGSGRRRQQESKGKREGWRRQARQV
ncbi:UNVERIFIED_CONTAM: hypothetical protein Sradi_5324600 [Sesamum radiatum]|uniref:Uncharacterized protein n=1 Tax=Sesamum radiatum TaxID=300843 RepID=A0AAW2LR23_SESRA